MCCDGGTEPAARFQPGKGQSQRKRKQALGEIPVVEREEERAAEGKLPRPPKKGGKPPLRNAAKQKFFGDRTAECIDH